MVVQTYQDFWDGNHDNLFDTTFWKPLGEPQFLPHNEKTMTNTEPTIVTWESLVTMRHFEYAIKKVRGQKEMKPIQDL
jgi:hypothetical protein